MKDIGDQIFSSMSNIYWEVDMAVNTCTSSRTYLRDMQTFFTSFPFELSQSPRL